MTEISHTSDSPPAAPTGSRNVRRMVDALASALGVPMDPEWRRAVAENFETDLEYAALVLGFDLTEARAASPFPCSPE
jgi:hypothetical protein